MAPDGQFSHGLEQGTNMPQDGYNVTILRLSCFLIVASDLRCILEGQMIVCHPVAELHLYCLNMIGDLAAKSS